MRKKRIWIIGVLSVALPSIAFLFYILLPKTELTIQTGLACNLNVQTCSVLLPDEGKMEISILPRPIPVAKLLQIEVTTEGIKPTKVEVDFAGVEMNMGPNCLNLHPRHNGQFYAEGDLPVCISGPMEWQATVILETRRKRLLIPFRFFSGNA